MTLSPPDIKAILDALEASDWDTATVTVDGVTISVARNGATAAPAPPSPDAVSTNAPPPPSVAAVSTNAPSGHVIAAPSVGVFWRSPRPGSPPFVEVGQTVAAGDTVCIVEMMKLMNNVVADGAGVVTAIHVENAAQGASGTPLISLEPGA